MRKIAVLTSGGDAPGMNAAVRAVVRTAIYNNIEVMGIKRGFNGLISRDMIPMGVSSVSDILQRGGTIIRTARSKEFKLKHVQEEAVNTLKELEIDGLIVIGGDGSFKGAHSLSKLGINTIGIPGTIDNDIPCTDSTIGFDTAVNTALESISKIKDTTTSHERANIIEVMGRNCGNIALFSGIAGGAETIIIPEIGFDVEEVCKTIERGKNRGKLHTIIVLAEGAGKAYDVGRQIQEKTGMETRTTILGYVQRGGSPTAFDRMLASRMGAMAVDLLLEGKTSRVVCIQKNQYVDMDINEALRVKREFNNKVYQLSKILSI